MKTVDELFEEIFEAVRANDQRRFDVLEHQLLARFEGGFSGMPRDVYERYLEIDRAWPPTPMRPPAEPSMGSASSRTSGAIDPDAQLGPRTALSARLPESLLEWLAEQAAATNSSRSDVLSACIRVVRHNPTIEAAVGNLLARRSGEPD